MGATFGKIRSALQQAQAGLLAAGEVLRARNAPDSWFWALHSLKTGSTSSIWIRNLSVLSQYGPAKDGIGPVRRIIGRWERIIRVGLVPADWGAQMESVFVQGSGGWEGKYGGLEGVDPWTGVDLAPAGASREPLLSFYPAVSRGRLCGRG